MLYCCSKKIMKKLYLIFINFNSGKQLYQGVTAVLRSSSVTGIIIVDNGSRDESMKYLDAIKDVNKLIVIKNKKNLQIIINLLLNYKNLRIIFIFIFIFIF